MAVGVSNPDGHFIYHHVHRDAGVVHCRQRCLVLVRRLYAKVWGWPTRGRNTGGKRIKSNCQYVVTVSFLRHSS
jgi:hypothetical protein